MLSVKIFKRLLENILFGKELKRFNDEILNEILNDIRQGKQVDAKLSYLIGKYVELHEINEESLFRDKTWLSFRKDKRCSSNYRSNQLGLNHGSS